MTIIDQIRNTLSGYGITYTDDQIQTFIDTAVQLIDSPLLTPTEYTDYVQDFNGDTYCTDFYPVMDINELKVNSKDIPISHTNQNGVIYMPYTVIGTLTCTYTVGLCPDEVNTDLVPIVVALIRDKEGQNVASVSEGDISVTYNNTTNATSTSLDTLIQQFKDKYTAVVRLI